VQIRWRKWLSRRSGAGRLTWDQFNRLLKRLTGRQSVKRNRFSAAINGDLPVNLLFGRESLSGCPDDRS